jgi:hypothetical protein
MGSSIDTRAPMPQPHLTLYGRDYVSKKRATTEAAFSDLKMIQSIAKTMTRKQEVPDRKGPVSLNADARKSEIFRIMKENHRLLDSLENLEPITKTSTLVKDYKHKQRYVILTSHSKRLAGEYDDDVMRIRTEDKAKTEEMNRTTQARLTRYRMNASQSMPSLTPLASTDPGILTEVSPAPKKRAKPVVTRPLNTTGEAAAAGGNGFQSSSSSNNAGAKNSKVSFSGGENEERSQNWQRAGGPTPHPKKIPSELFYADEDAPAAKEASSPAAAAGAPAESVPRELIIEESVPREFVAEAPPAAEAAEAPPAAAPVAAGISPSKGNDASAEPPKVGVAAAPDSADASGTFEDYSNDFADDTQNSMSKALNDTKGVDESGTFEDTFEESLPAAP